MTYGELYQKIQEQLTRAGCDSPSFDAVCLLEDVGGMPPHGMPQWDTRLLSKQAVMAVTKAAAARAAGRPLQYIVGEWDFLTLQLSVGEGVLIPRPDTECLCETVALWLQRRGTPATVLDLCAGTGAVGLGVACLCPLPLRVTAVEYFADAFAYLQKNIARYPAYDVTPVQADVLREAAQFPDGYTVIVSNPPYIPTADLAGLMREVQHEPVTALDGDRDGLRFYRAIADHWIPKLIPGGLCAVEVGVGQADAVSALFAGAGLTDIQCVLDLAGIPRVVCGEYNKT